MSDIYTDTGFCGAQQRGTPGQAKNSQNCTKNRKNSVKPMQKIKNFQTETPGKKLTTGGVFF